MVTDVYADIKMEIRARLGHGHGVGAILAWLAIRYWDEGRVEYKRVMGEVARADDPRAWLWTFCEE